MRLFAAVPLPVSTREAIAAACQPLREALPPARWVPAEQLHVTLRFWGEAPAACIAELTGALRRSLDGVSPFTTGLSGAGCFPEGREARVAWVGFANPVAWGPLAEAVARAAAEFEPLRRGPFVPHVTVARPRRAWPRRAAAHWTRRCPAFLGGPFRVEEVGLFASELQSTGALHQLLAGLSLAGPA